MQRETSRVLRKAWAFLFVHFLFTFSSSSDGLKQLRKRAINHGILKRDLSQSNDRGFYASLTMSLIDVMASQIF